MTRAKAKTPAKPTDYVVLERLKRDNGDGRTAEVWLPLNDGQTFSAGSKTEAIKAASGDAEGTFKAVPLSSWKGGVTQAQTTMLKREAID